MRKAMLSALLISVLLMGCNVKQKATVINLRGTSFIADVEYEGSDYSAFCVIDKNKNLNVKILKPNILNGVEILLDNSFGKISYEGLELDGINDFLPIKSFPGLLTQVIDCCDNSEFIYSKSHNRISGKLIGGENFVFYVSPGGLPISLKVDKPNLTVNFRKISYA